MKQHGFSIVEAMISMLIGIILLAGSMQVFISSKKSFLLQDAISQIQDDARFAIHFITRDLRHAGYPQGNLGVNEGAGEALAFDISDNKTSNNSSEGSDQLAIKYESLADCTGNATPLKQGYSRVTINHYRLDSAILKCSGNSGNTMELAENVEKFHALYGVDTDGDGVANYYQHADNITGGASSWNSIVSVRFALLFASSDSVGARQKAFSLLNEGAYIPPDDGKLRRVFVSTVMLRNRI